MRRLSPAVAGIAAFVVTCPLLFRGGGNDGDIPVFRYYGHLIRTGSVPYRDFHPEYPPGALALFTLPSLISERHYLAIFRILSAIGVVVLLVLLGILAERLHAGRTVSYAALVFAGLAPALLGAFMLRRFDMWPAAICVGVLILLLDRRPVPALALLALGAVVKVYPLALLPVALLATPRAARLRALAAFCVVGLVVMVPFAVIGHAGLYDSVVGQADRHLHVDTIGSSILLALHRPVRLAYDGGGWSDFGGDAGAVATVQTVLQVAAIVLAAVLFARSRRGPSELVAAAAATVAAAAILGKILTPQYVFWLVPLVVLAGGAAATGLFAAALLCTNVLFPDRYASLLAKHDAQIWLLLARNALLVATVAVLFARAWEGAAATATRERAP
jgi:uncharacterized membrane protein